MNEEVKRIVDALRGEDNCDVLEYIEYIDDAADLLENLAAENVRNEIQIDMLRHDKEELNGIIDNLKARCEAAEKEIPHDCYTCAYLIKSDPRQCSFGCILKPFAIEHAERCKWEWRGPQDGENEDEEP